MNVGGLVEGRDVGVSSVAMLEADPSELGLSVKSEVWLLVGARLSSVSVGVTERDAVKCVE